MTARRAVTAVLRPRISVAPMVDVTDTSFRQLVRLLTKRTFVYTPMLIDQAVVRVAESKHLLEYDQVEHPIVAQLGGHDPVALARASEMCERAGFDEVNLNVGCPAASAQRCTHGAGLMLAPELPSLVQAMQRAVSIPVSVKCRIGVDEHDSYAHFRDFIKRVHETSGIVHFIVHARKALLARSTRANRNVPPLKYEFVYALKKEMPHLFVELNGGVTTVAQIKEHLAQGMDGVMLGRTSYQNVYLLGQIDREFFGETAATPSRHEVVRRYLQHAEPREAELCARGVTAASARATLLRPINSLFAGLPGSRAWSQALAAPTAADAAAGTPHSRLYQSGTLSELVAAALNSAEVAAEREREHKQRYLEEQQQQRQPAGGVQRTATVTMA